MGSGHASSGGADLGLVEDRFGLDTIIESSKVGIGGVVLRGVELSDPSGAISVKADRIEARVTPWGALLAGTRGVSALSAEGVKVALDLAEPSVVETLAMFRKSRRNNTSTSSAGATGGSGRAYTIRDLDITVRDDHGELAKLIGLSLRKQGDEASASLAQTIVGGASGDHAQIGASSLALERIGGTWVIDRLTIDGADVRWLGDPSEQSQPLAFRVKRAVQALSGAPHPTAGAQSLSPAPDPTSVEPRILSRVSPDARLRLSRVAVESRTPDGHTERIQDFEASLTGEGRGWFRLVAQGQTSNEGVLRINVRTQPEQAHAEGTVVARDISLALVAPFIPQVPLHNPEIGTASAELQLDADSPDQVRIAGEVELRDVGLFSERLAGEPIKDITVHAEGDGVWFPAQRRLLVEQGRIRMGRARVLIEGEAERTPEHYRLDLMATVPPTPCNDVVGAIPKDVLGPVAGFSWSGTWSGIGRIVLDSRDLEATELAIRVRNLCEFQTTPRWVRVERFEQPFRHTVMESDDVSFQMVTGPGTDVWVPLEDVSPFMVQAVLSHEDARFYDHGGFAPWAIRDALVRNLQEGRYVVGASTISMQLAKNLYLQREKTIVRKVQEVILTWWLENALNKDEILELYLNVIEYGPATYGLVETHLTTTLAGHACRAQPRVRAAFLACILPSPKRYHMLLRAGRAFSEHAWAHGTRLLEHMAKRERIGPEELLSLRPCGDRRVLRVPAGWRASCRCRGRSRRSARPPDDAPRA